MRFIFNKKINSIFNEVAEVGLALWQKGWAEKNAGNISVNISEFIIEKENTNLFHYFSLNKCYPILSGQYLLVTSTGSRMRDIIKNPEASACIIKVSDDGNGYYLLSDHNIDLKPTSELPTHLAIHELLIENGSKEKAIVHTHPNTLIALSHIVEYKNEANLNKLLWSMHSETYMMLPRGAGFISYSTPGSDELASKTFREFAYHKVLIWEKHGCIAIGKDVFEAFDLIDIVSKSAEIFFTCRNAGFIPEGITDRQLEKIKKQAL